MTLFRAIPSYPIVGPAQVKRHGRIRHTGSCRSDRLLLLWLSCPPKRNPPQCGLHCLNDIVPFSLKPLGDSLAPRQGNQTGEKDSAAWFALDCKPAYIQGVQLLLENDPVIADGSNRLRCR
jgi:hypothetical protein